MAERPIVSFSVGDRVFGNVPYWFSAEELAISDEAAESLLRSKGVPTIEIQQLGFHVLFSRESVAALKEAGVVRYVPL